MISAASVGAPAGFLARVSCLEREVAFLKQKVEDDARWKHIVQQWVLDNFAFDIQGTLIHGQRNQFFPVQTRASTVLPQQTYRQQPSAAGARSSPTKSPKKAKRCSTSPSKKTPPIPQSEAEASNAKTTPTTDSVGPGFTVISGSEDAQSHTVKVERVESVSGRGLELYPEEEESCNVSPDFMEDEEEEEDEQSCFRGLMDTGDINPKDLIITPDICSETAGDFEDVGARPSSNNCNEDNERHDPCSDQESSSSSSDEEESTRRPHRKMEWSLIGTYPNLRVFQEQFNMRAWGLSTRQLIGEGAKLYYYCKECRKHGPGKLHIRYKDANSVVEVLKNHLGHDHSTNRRVNEEMKVEILNLYKSGMQDSPKILAALKVSKPHMREPSLKQICRVLKPFREQDRKSKLKEKKKAAKAKEKLSGKLLKKVAKPRPGSGLGTEVPTSLAGSSLLPNFPSTNASGHPQHLNQYIVPSDSREYHSSGVPLSGFGPPTQQMQVLYHQQNNQRHQPDYDPNSGIHMGQHYS